MPKISLLFVILLSATFQVASQNLWTQLPNPSFAARTTGIEFAIDTDGDGKSDKGYIGAGFNFANQNYDDLWQYDPATGVWTQKANFPGIGKRNFVNFQLGGIAYVGFGAYGGSSLSNELWAYDPIANTWTQKNNMPGGARWGAVTFTINNKVYFGLGNGSGSSSNPQFRADFYEYDAINDTWQTKASFPGAGRVEPGSFSVDTDNDGVSDRGFLIAGGNLTSAFKDVWEYIPTSNIWVQKQDMPSVRMSPTAFVLNNEPYIGLGNASTGNVLIDFWKYEIATDSWLRMSDFPGTAVWGTYEFVIDDVAYVLDGAPSGGNVVRQFYKYAPLVNGYSEIRGNVFADGNNNCNLGGAEFGLANIPVQAFPGPYLTSTDANGDYVFRVPVGNYSVSAVVPSHLGPNFTGFNCPANGTYTNINIAALGIDTSGFDFAIEALQCPRLSVKVASSGRLRCFDNFTVISYCNYGLVAEDSVYIDLTLPNFISIINASEVFTAIDSVTYRFYLGNVAAGTCGDIFIQDYVSCANIDLLGAAACTEVNIFPANTCLPQNPAWNGANVDINATCLAGGDTVRITVSNTGSNVMADSSALRIYFDGVLSYTENFLLPTGGSYSLLIPSNGITIMAEADQVNGHPYSQHVVTWVERCQVDTLAVPLFTIIPSFPLGDEYEQYDVECLAVSGSFDPNDKQAYPSGVGANNIIPPGTVINYKLRFQNTGTDTARNVYLVDTLSNDLDVATLQLNAASHPYRMELSGVGKTIVTFYFDNIMLPDSNVNQLGSNGFVSFSIAPKANTPLGTVVENFADIYFDFNPPVRTNTVLQTVDLLPVNLVGIKENNIIILLDVHAAPGKQQLHVFPNPTSGVLNIAALFPSNGQVAVSVMDLLGRVVVSERFYGTAGGTEIVGLNLSHLLSGIYVVSMNLNGQVTTAKLIKE